MKRIVRLSLLVLFLAIAATSSASLWAEPLEHPMYQQTNPGLDLVLLIDESGSTWFRTDPEPDGLEPDPDTGIFESKPPLNREPPFRIQAAQLLINMLAVEPQNDHQVSVYLFGSRTENVVTNEVVNTNSAQEINRNILQKHYEIGASLLWTDIDTALDDALETLRTVPQDPDRRSVILLITDGKPETENANTQNGPDAPETLAFAEYLTQLEATIAEINLSVPNGANACPNSEQTVRPVYVLAVTLDAQSALANTPYVEVRYPNFWVQPEIVGSQYRSVIDFGDLNPQITHLTADLLCARPIPISPALSLPQEYKYEVRDNYRAIIFTIITSEPNIAQAIITPPGGDPIGVRANKSGDLEYSLPDGVAYAPGSNNQVWRVDRQEYDGPWTGEWTVEVDGSGTVRFGFLPFADDFSIGLLSPAQNEHPAGKELDIVWQVLDEDGNFSSDPVPASAFIVSYDREVPPSELFEDQIVPGIGANDDGTYQARLGEPPPGFYTLGIEAQIDTQSSAVLVPPKTLNVLPIPWIDLVQPAPGRALFVNEAIDVQVLVRLMDYGDTSAERIDEFTALDIEIIAELRAPYDGSTVAQGVLQPSTSGNAGFTHDGTITAPDTAGEYELHLRLESNGVPGDERTIDVDIRDNQVAPPTEIPPTVEPTPITEPPLPSPPDEDEGGLGNILLGGLVLLVLGAAIFMARSMLGVPLNGTYLTNDQSGDSIDLTGRRQNITLNGSDGVSHAVVRLMRQKIEDPNVKGNKINQAVAQVKRIAEGQNLEINSMSAQQGDTIPLPSGGRIQLDGGDTYTFHDPTSIPE